MLSWYLLFSSRQHSQCSFWPSSVRELCGTKTTVALSAVSIFRNEMTSSFTSEAITERSTSFFQQSEFEKARVFLLWMFTYELQGTGCLLKVILHHERPASPALFLHARPPRKPKKLFWSTYWSVPQPFPCFRIWFLFRLCTTGLTWNHVMAQHSGMSLDVVQSARQAYSRTLSAI